MSNTDFELDGAYRNQIDDILSNVEIKKIYEIIYNSNNGVTKQEIKNNCKLDDIDNVLDTLADMYLIREKCKYTSSGIDKVYEKDVILGGYEDTIKKHINN